MNSTCCVAHLMMVLMISVWFLFEPLRDENLTVREDLQVLSGVTATQIKDILRQTHYKTPYTPLRSKKAKRREKLAIKNFQNQR